MPTITSKELTDTNMGLRELPGCLAWIGRQSQGLRAAGDLRALFPRYPFNPSAPHCGLDRSVD
jgi:hypothetical protein